MKLAMEQAGSTFAGWIVSCLTCLGLEDSKESSSRHAMMSEAEVQPEMSQPHLVPPMKLAVHDDDLPGSSPPPRTPSLQSWIMEGRRSIASRASNRASLSFKRHHPTTTSLRISAPTDFKRITVSPVQFNFQPLVLKIHTPGNRLSDLPTFDDFFSPFDQQQRLTQPPRALVSVSISNTHLSRTRSHHPSSSFQLARKPVGSGSRRSSLATLEQLHLLEKQTPITSPLLPPFSTRTSTTDIITNTSDAIPLTHHSHSHTRQESTTSFYRYRSTIPPKTPPDRPSPGRESTPSRTGRVSQWLFQFQPEPEPEPTPPISPKSTRSDCKNPVARIRSRTLSGSTVVSSTATGTWPSPTSEKERGSYNNIHRPGQDIALSVSPDGAAAAYPTIYEEQQQQQQQHYRFDGLDYRVDHRRSTIGLAF